MDEEDIELVLVEKVFYLRKLVEIATMQINRPYLDGSVSFVQFFLLLDLEGIVSSRSSS